MYRILIVDDEAKIREVLAEYAEFEGYQADQAADGMEAVAKCRQNDYDIIIMDISMPEMNGVMAAKYIRQIDDKCSIIFLTAYDDFEYARNAIKIRALDYLLKPCDINDLLAVMDMAIQKLDRECDFKGNTKENKPERKRENVKNFDEQTTIKYLREYVENNYTFDISMQEVAEDMGYSDAYFSKLFKQYFNQNFTAYLTEYRIKKAKELLTDTNNSIKDISRMVGYEDSNYFAKIFKRIVGEIPSKFRENLIKN